MNWFRWFHLRVLSILSPQSIAQQGVNQQMISVLPWPASVPPLGRKLLRRRFDLGGASLEMQGNIDWRCENAPESWRKEFYSFGWIHEVAAANQHKLAASFVREFINNFANARDNLSSEAWNSDIAAKRMALWLLYRPFYLKGGSKAFRRRLGKSIFQHLRRLYGNTKHDNNKNKWGISTAWGLINAAALLPEAGFLMDAACDAMRKAIAREFPVGNIHISQNPSQHLAALQILIAAWVVLPDEELGEASFHHELGKFIEQAGQSLRLLCHGDGRLALFFGGTMENAALIARILSLSGIEDEAPQGLHAFPSLCRLARRKTIVFFQTFSNVQGKSALSIEFSDEGERFVVNCGGYLGTDPRWKQVVRQPEAHSTLSISELPPLEAVARAEEIPTPIFHEERGNLIAQNSSDNFIAQNIRHTRMIQLSKSGDRFAGIDSLTCLEEKTDTTASLRFHLHPDIRCQPQKDGSIRLVSVSGKVWMFSNNIPENLRVEESVYLGHDGHPQKTQQIVITSLLNAPETNCEWVFVKI